MSDIEDSMENGAISELHVSVEEVVSNYLWAIHILRFIIFLWEESDVRKMLATKELAGYTPKFLGPEKTHSLTHSLTPVVNDGTYFFLWM